MNADLIAALQHHLFTTQEDILQLREAAKRLDAAVYAARQKGRPGPKGSTSVLAPKPRESESELRDQIAELETEVHIVFCKTTFSAIDMFCTASSSYLSRARTSSMRKLY